LTVEIREETPAALAEYARVPIAFSVRERLDVAAAEAGLAGLRFTVTPVSEPYVKDYDAEPGQHPTGWPERFDLSRWGILAAWAGGARAGGAVVAWDTPRLTMLEDAPPATAVLWDLRVAPAWRGRGVGRALFGAAERWALARGARWLKVETQNVNVAACRFYARQGCTLGGIHRFAYHTLPDETQLLWYKPLRPGQDGRRPGCGAEHMDERTPSPPGAIRPATAGDIPALFAVRTSVRENHLDLAQLAERGVTPGSIAAMLAAGDAAAWVVEEGGRVVAFSMADAQVGTVFALFVGPGSERRGHGRRLLAAAERWLFSAGWETIWLQTGREPQLRAHRLYAAAGWRLVGPADDEDVRYEKSRPR
jgi:GNAT superfamily N-acetyltransferase